MTIEYNNKETGNAVPVLLLPSYKKVIVTGIGKKMLTEVERKITKILRMYQGKLAGKTPSTRKSQKKCEIETQI